MGILLGGTRLMDVRKAFNKPEECIQKLTRSKSEVLLDKLPVYFDFSGRDIHPGIFEMIY